MAERIDCVVVGAGVVGLAVARAIAQSGREVLVIEAQATIGTGTSSRNSEVIHAGIYYPRGSAKARLCVEGRRLLYDYCATHGIEHRRCGKLIVATDRTQLDRLKGIEVAASANGVSDLHWIDADEATAMEPALNCVAALHSPSTGIVDSHGLMVSLQADIERKGGAVVFRTPLVSGRGVRGGMVIEAGSEADSITLLASVVINCAGLGAQEVARRLTVPPGQIPPLYYAKGNYFCLRGGTPFKRLIYPVPEPGGLGVHLTLDLAGQARFGPDVEWVKEICYTVNSDRAAGFYAAIRQYWPGLPDAALQPAYAGIRPKLSGPGEPAADFTIQGPDQHGLPHLINLYGIESPGLTAALAIGQTIAEQVSDWG